MDWRNNFVFFLEKIGKFKADLLKLFTFQFLIFN